MGYKDKTKGKAKYKKNIYRQARDKLVSMQAYGQSKKAAMADGTAEQKIFSFNTYKTYLKHTNYFLKYVSKKYPDVKKLKDAKQYVHEWLQYRTDQGLSAWTIQTEAKALGKLYGIRQDDPDYFVPPIRCRVDITRSRGNAARDRHFSEKNNDQLIRFCRGVGARRAGLTKLKGRDLLTREEIESVVKTLEAKANTRKLSSQEEKDFNIHRDALMFRDVNYFVFLKEKGGRERISPIIGPDVDLIVGMFRETAPDAKVFPSGINSNADIHGYRSDYANRVYKMYARNIEDIPYDRINGGSGKKFQSDVYRCRGDEKGRVLDKRAMLLCSKALGHNRISIVADNYLR